MNKSLEMVPAFLTTRVSVPALIAGAGNQACERFLEFCRVDPEPQYPHPYLQAANQFFT